jgi:protein involved in polysaccharide export with SLBB domain
MIKCMVDMLQKVRFRNREAGGIDAGEEEEGMEKPEDRGQMTEDRRQRADDHKGHGACGREHGLQLRKAVPFLILFFLIGPFLTLSSSAEGQSGQGMPIQAEQNFAFPKLPPVDSGAPQIPAGEQGKEATSEPQQQKEETSIKPPRAEEKITSQDKGSRIERILSGQFPKEISRELRQFGYDFFRTDVSTFAPVTNVPVGDDYVIGPGDGFVIHLWGNVEESYKATVSRDGRIALPRIGSLGVAGMTLEELKRFLNSKFKQYFPGFEMNLTMADLRTLEIFIVGEANYPGTYSVSSLSTVITALYAAGGPSKNGSLRNIKLIRNGQNPISLDLYDFLIQGSKGSDLRLNSGDTVFIPVLGAVAGIAGNVRRPAIYELKGSQTIGDLIGLSGGVLPTGRLQNVVVERIEGHQKRIIRSFNLDPSSSAADHNLRIPLKDGDVVKIYPVHDKLRQVVYLEGHVKYPMEYEMKPGMRIRDLIPSYDSLLPGPYLARAEIVRLVPPDLHPEILYFSPAGLLSGDESQNFPLQDLDRVVLYASEEKTGTAMVSIKGEVKNPGAYRLYPGMTVKDLIFQSGNLTHKAYLEKANLTRVVSVNGGADTVKIGFSPSRALDELAEDNVRLQRDDEVFIRQIPNYTESLRRRVHLEGEFLFPGEYAFSEGERLSSIIERAGGLTAEAYPFGAVFMRESVKEVQGERLKEYISRLEEDILASVAGGEAFTQDSAQAASFKQSMAAKKQLLDKLKGARPSGRMVIDLEEVLVLPSSKFNFEVKPGDRVVVQKRPDHINVLGEVFNPTAIFAEKDKPVDFYLDRVGGTTDNADDGQIYVVRANGSVISKSQGGLLGLATWDGEKKRWNLGGFGSVDLYPGDTIIVPRETEKYRWWTVTKDIVDVAYKVAVAAGVLVVAF